MSADDPIHAAVTDITRQESRGSALLWFAVLGSPLAWFAHLTIGYSLEEWFACSPATSDRGQILGFGVDAVSWTLNGAVALVALASGLTALWCWRRPADIADDDSRERSRWMAFAGTVEGAVFLAAILLGFFPPLLLDTCGTAP